MNKYDILNQIINPVLKVSNEFLEKCRKGDQSFRDLNRYPMLGDLVIFRFEDKEFTFSKVFNIYIGKVIAIDYTTCSIRAQYQIREEDGHREGMEVIKDISTTWSKVYPIDLSNSILEDLGFEKYFHKVLPIFNYKLKIQDWGLYINAYRNGKRIENGYRDFFYLKYGNKGCGKYLHQLVAYIKNLELDTVIWEKQWE